jgi:5'-3' exonuclease
MGIKNFFTWFRNNELFKDAVLKHVPPVYTDHILIDMNGIIHQAAQQVYKYGKYANAQQPCTVQIPERLKKYIYTNIPQTLQDRRQQLEIDLFESVKTQVNAILKMVIPIKTVFLAVDGVAPKSKQNQQRQRRFRAAEERTPGSFDSACITAGTDFMQKLCDHITDKSWLDINPSTNYIFSSHSVPGEGEHKLIEWIKNSEHESDSFTVVGLDADLILLCLCLDKKNVYILREKEYRGYDWIDIESARRNLERKNVNVSDILVWSCFLGNDFLPPIPSLEIKESFPEKGAFEFFFDNYKDPLIVNNVLNFKEIKRLLTLLSAREQSIMNGRLVEEKTSYSKNREGKPVTRFANTLWKGDIEKYRREYFTTKLVRTSTDAEITQEKVIHLFLKTVYWVYVYYTKRTKIDWNWFYPYSYALHAADFVEHMKEECEFEFDISATPCHYHEQLLRVMPPQSKSVLPEFLRDRLEEINRDFIYEVDFAGKRFEWEAVTIVNNV